MLDFPILSKNRPSLSPNRPMLPSHLCRTIFFGTEDHPGRSRLIDRARFTSLTNVLQHISRRRQIMLKRAKSSAALIAIRALLLVLWWLHLRSRREASHQPVPAAAGFDAARAFADLKGLVDFGPRPAGS